MDLERPFSSHLLLRQSRATSMRRLTISFPCHHVQVVTVMEYSVRSAFAGPITRHEVAPSPVSGHCCVGRFARFQVKGG